MLLRRGESLNDIVTSLKTSSFKYISRCMAEEDNSKCRYKFLSFSIQAARYIAFKASKQQLDNLPFQIRSVAVEKDRSQGDDDVINEYLWFFTLFVIVIVLMFGIWYQRRKKGTSLWVPPTLTELTNPSHNENSTAVPKKMCKEVG